MITILTPTYNREKNLSHLYESLAKQSNKDFEWLVIDDGSSDNTKALIEGFISAESKEKDAFPISYVRQENGGKHTALNRGISLAKGELLFIVDSDDWLSEDAVQTILDYHKKYAARKVADNLCGYSFLRVYSNGEVNTGEFPEDEKIDTYRQQRINNNLLGDKAEVYYTDILKRYPFEVFEGERFMPEDAVWLKMSGPYNMVHINKAIYISDYLEGGLTKSGRKMKVFSPYGMMYRSAVYLKDPQVKLKVKVKMMMLYQVYSRFAVMRDKEKKLTDQQIVEKRKRVVISKGLLYFLCIPASTLIYMRWNKKY